MYGRFNEGKYQGKSNARMRPKNVKTLFVGILKGVSPSTHAPLSPYCSQSLQSCSHFVKNPWTAFENKIKLMTLRVR